MNTPSTLIGLTVLTLMSVHTPITDRLAELPLRFESNAGQAPDGVDYIARATGHSLLLDSDGFALRLDTGASDIRFHFLNAKDTPSHRAEDPLPGITNYFRGNDPDQWVRGVAGHARVRYSDIYDGIGVVYYGRNGFLEYDFEVDPASDPNAIAIQCEGADEVYLDVDGHLVVRVGSSELTFRRPIAFQVADGKRVDVPVAYADLGGETYGFELAEYDRHLPLTVDPMIDYATFFGGNGDDHPWDIAVDEAGNAYVTGSTTSTNIHTSTGAFDEVGNVGGFSDPGDVFIAKIDPTGSNLVYGTYLSGRFADIAYSIAVDDSGNAYVMGTTDSDDDPGTAGVNEGFPLRNPIQPTYGGNTDLFVAKINADGTDLVYSTYVGGDDLDRADSEQDKPGITVDSQGSAYVAGGTQSTNFPTTPGAFSTTAPGAFALKLNPGGSAFDYATFLGGDTFVFVWDCVVNDSGELLLCGFTGNPNLPTTSGVINEVKNAAEDGFIYKLTADGSDLVLCTYFGGDSDDFLHAIDIDASENIYVAGFTTSANYPVTSGSVPSSGAPISKLDSGATAVQYSLFTGGNFAYAVGVDQLGRASVTGDGPATPPDRDVFFTHISASGFIEFETFFGGFFQDIGWGLDLDGFGHAYVTGVTSSSSFPGKDVINPSPLQGSIGSVPDGFIVKVLRDDPVSVESTETPRPFALAPARPNPAGSGASIGWTQTEPSVVTIRIFDSAGRLVRMLKHDHRGVGVFDAWWDGTDRRGRRVAPGTYYGRVDVGSFSESTSIVVVR